MAGSGQSMPWSDAEDRLLCAIVHEFGSNWFLVADVLSASCAMQGIYRSPTTCRYRFRNLTVSPYSCVWAANHLQITKCLGPMTPLHPLYTPLERFSALTPVQS